jgi:hypothetical protein
MSTESQKTTDQAWRDRPENKARHARNRLLWMRANKSKVSAYNATYRKSRPELHAWRNYKGNAERRGIEFLLVREHFLDLVTDNCFYCTASPNPLNGIDRVDNSQGYTEDNVVTACRLCNRAKNDLSREKFEEWAVRLAHNIEKWNGVILKGNS